MIQTNRVNHQTTVWESWSVGNSPRRVLQNVTFCVEVKVYQLRECFQAYHAHTDGHGRTRTRTQT